MDVGTASQWVGQGVSRARLGTMVRHGELVRLRYGAYVTAAAIADAGDDAAKRHALHVRALLAVSAPGAVAPARRGTIRGDGRSGSPLESRARVVFAAYGLPPPELQATVHAGYKLNADGTLRYLTEYHDYVVDFLWRDRMTIAEVDGKLKYKSGADAIRQNNRDTLLHEQGFQVVHITQEHLVKFPEVVIERILTAFATALHN